MKICTIICEYNPFHNGHLYQIQEAKARSNADAILCIMSGNFVQRGEAAIMDKYTRARHAVLAGADVVIELPVIFATSNAELFAKGALSILSKIPAVNTLCFGAETADTELLYQAANHLNNEPKEISKAIQNKIESGVSYAKARANAWEKLLPNDLLTSPNNILALEYTRAILSMNADIQILPIQRKGGGYADYTLHDNFSSASAIRKEIANGKSISGNIPDFVISDISAFTAPPLDALEKYAILSTPLAEIKKVCDCTEGLENAFKKAATEPETLVSVLTSPRYTSARIRRIALQNLLNIHEELIRESLQSNLYLRILAAKKNHSDVLSELSNSKLPLLIRAHDEDVLEGTAKKAFEKELFAEKVYSILYPELKKKEIFH